MLLIVINFVESDLCKYLFIFTLGNLLKILNLELVSGFHTLTERGSWIHLSVVVLLLHMLLEDCTYMAMLEVVSF